MKQSKKIEAVGKYTADMLRTLGLALSLYAVFGLVMQRSEAYENLAATVTLLIVGMSSIVTGAILMLIFTLETDKK